MIVSTVFSAVDRFSAPLMGMSRGVNAFTSSVESKFARINRTLNRVKTSTDSAFASMTGGQGAVVLAGSVGLATLAVKSFITEASKVENATAAFTPLLGGVEKAQKLVKVLNEEAATTPFIFEDISSVASTLLPVMNGDIEKVTKTFRMLGDTSGGSVDKLQRVTLGYSKALLKGKVTLESLSIIAEAGVPIFAEMAKSMNLGDGVKGTSKLFDMITKGQVPVEALTKTFEKMTSKGGIFFRGMIIASETFTGVTSTLEDNLKMTSASIGTAMLPILKEYALKIIDVTASVRTWVESNKELIAGKVTSFMQKLANVAKFVYDNFDKILFVLKLYIGALITLKVTSLAVGLVTNGIAIAQGLYSAAMFVSNVALGIYNGLMGISTVYTEAQTVAKYASIAATYAITAAQWLWNASLTAGAIAMQILMSPITLIVLAIAAMVAIVYVAIKYWNQFGAAISFLMGPIGMVISLIQSLRANWEMVKTAFTTGGILEGFKAIGAVILDSLLAPLQQVLELIGKVTGADWATSAAKGLNDFRVNSLGTQGATQETQTLPTVNKEATKQESFINSFTSSKQNVAIDINDNTGNAKMKTDGNAVPIKMTSTKSF